MADCTNCPSQGECTSQDTCMIKNNPYNSIKKVIGVMSGKGGVGKSTVSALIAKELKEKGYKVGIHGCRYHRAEHPEAAGREG